MKMLKILREKAGLTLYRLGSDLELSPQVLSRYEREEREPDIGTIKKIADYFGVTTDYLLDKKGDTKNIYTFDNIRPISVQKIPLLGSIACGKPIFTNEERESYVLAGTDIKVDFCLIAKGDSMIGARIQEGDIVFIKQQPMVEHGEIAAVIVNDEATLKRVYYYPEKKKLVLQSENPKYEPLVYIDNELDEIRILGKAIAFQSDLK